MLAMQIRTPRAAGLSPTLRHLMIFVLCVATLLAVFVSLMKNQLLGDKPDLVCLNVALLVASYPVPWMMILLFLLDRRGPIRNWYIARCMASWGLVAGIAFLLADPVSWVLCGRLTIVFPIHPITGLVCLAGLPNSLRSVQPGRCLRCGQKSVISVATRFERKISNDTGWCASCGAAYQRENLGKWMPSDAT
jgi:hypothetical protein